MLALTSLAVLALALGARAQLVISTPDEVVQCKEAVFHISGGEGPWNAYVVKKSDPCGDALQEIESFTGDLTWTPPFPAGDEEYMIALEKDEGDGQISEAWTGGFKVKQSDDDACLAAAAAPTTTATTISVPSPARTTSRTLTAPVNVGSDDSTPEDDIPNSGSRAVIGVSSVVALVGAAVAAFAL